MPTSSKLFSEHAVQLLEVIGSTRGRHLNNTGVEGEVIESILRDMEGTTRLDSSHLGIKLIDARLFHVNGIFHPSVGLCG